jgi:hypothetical protein
MVKIYNVNVENIPCKASAGIAICVIKIENYE